MDELGGAEDPSRARHRRNETIAVLGAVSGIVTALAALVALVVIPLQISAQDGITRSQTSREIYREFLNLTVQKPEVAELDWCRIADRRQRIAYQAYVDYLTYTAEQVMDAEDGWDGPMRAHLEDHMNYVCALGDLGVHAAPVAALLTDLRRSCGPQNVCPAGTPAP